MLTRSERKNMIDFILKLREMDTGKVMYMTDDEIEHCYRIVYASQESECQIQL